MVQRGRRDSPKGWRSSAPGSSGLQKGPKQGCSMSSGSEAGTYRHFQRKPKKMIADDLVQIEHDLESMRVLNNKPMYLYYCAKAEFEIARRNRLLARSALAEARGEVKRNNKAYVAGFLQKGIMVPGFRPPPKDSFKERFKVTQEKIDRMPRLARRSDSASHGHRTPV
jgi:hypothetical protein